MKNLIISSLLLLLALSSTTAQNFAPPEAVWKYTYHALTANGYIEVSVASDTVIEGLQCKKLAKNKHYYNALTESFGTEYMGAEYVHHNLSDNQVLLFRQGAFTTLYDFGAEVGDAWEVPGTGLCSNPGTVRVDSIDSVVINGSELRRLHVTAEDNSHYDFTNGMIVETIGCLGYMFPQPTVHCGIADGDDGGWELRCYNDGSLGEFQTGVVSDCDFILSSGIDEGSSIQRVSVYPNPFSDEIRIVNDSKQAISKITIASLNGAIQEEYNVNENITVDLRHLASGLYVLHVHRNDFITHLKIIKN